MTPVIYENIYNHEQFVCEDNRNVRIVDGVEYLQVYRKNMPNAKVLMRRDALSQIRIPKSKKK